MDLRLDADQLAFRENVQARLQAVIPPQVRDHIYRGLAPSRDDMLVSHRALHAQGWAVPHWSVAWGGAGWDPARLILLHEELGLACVPPPLPANVLMLGPVLAAFGSLEQKRRFLRRAAQLDDWWCLAFADFDPRVERPPRLSARRTSDGYLVSGRSAVAKDASHADWLLALVRTDPQATASRGFSLLAIPTQTSGILVSTSASFDSAEQECELTLDRVQVPFNLLIGAEHHGWDYANFLLGYDRTGIAGTGVTAELVARIRALVLDGRDATRQDSLRLKTMALEADLAALRAMQWRIGASHRLEDPVSIAVSMLKISGSRLQDRALALLQEVQQTRLFDARLDRPARGLDVALPPMARGYQAWWKRSMSCGSDEIHHYMITQSALS